MHNVTALLFLDPTEINTSIDDLTMKEEPGFMGQMLGSIRGMFASKGRTVNDLGKDLSTRLILIEIDATNPEFKSLNEMFNVTEIPYLVILQEGQTLFKAVPTKKTTKEVLDIISKADELCNIKMHNGTETGEKGTEVITISPEKSQFKSIDKEDPFYFGDNVPVYDKALYTDPMNGGLIASSDRIPGFSAPPKIASIKEQPKEAELKSVKPSDRLSKVEKIAYYQDPLYKEDQISQPRRYRPVQVVQERQQVVEAPKEVYVRQPVHSMNDKAFEHPVNITVVKPQEKKEVIKITETIVEVPKPVEAPKNITQVTPVEIKTVVKEEVIIPEAPTRITNVTINQIRPVQVPQVTPVELPEVKEIELNQVRKVKIAQIKPVEIDQIVPVRVPQKVVEQAVIQVPVARQSVVQQPPPQQIAPKVVQKYVPIQQFEPVRVETIKEIHPSDYIPSVGSEKVIYREVIEEQ